MHDLTTLHYKPLDNGGVFCEYSGSLVVVPKIDYNDLKKNHEKDLTLTRNAFTKVIQKNAKDLKEAKAALKKWDQHGKGRPSGSYDYTDACILADAVRGKRVRDIQSIEYPYPPYKDCKTFSRGKINRVLSVNKDDDWERIYDLYEKFPDVFEGVSAADLAVWYNERRKK